jgi:hypothetical protein
LTNGEGGLIMKNWILRKIFFSKTMKYIRKGYYLQAYYQGKADEQQDRLLEGLDKK